MAGCCYVPKRYILVVLAHFGFFVVYALRVNLSVALVAMVNSTKSHGNVSHEKKGGEFNWDENQQGLVLSSFFYGYLFTQIPGGFLGNRFGGKWVFGLGVLVTALLTMLTPIAARASFYLLLAIRVLEGIGEGVTFPAMHAMVGKWAPANERARMATVSYTGAYTGTVISLPLSSILSSSTFLGGWPSAFYVFGILGFIWFIIWMVCVSDSPELHSTISHGEKMLILDSQKGCSSETNNARVPWLSIFSSIHVWAIIVAHFCNNWVWYLVLTDLPTYFNQVLNFNLTKNGFLSALPFLVASITSLGGGYLADFISARCLSIGLTRKLFSTIAFYTAGICLTLASYAHSDQISLSVAYMVIGTGVLCLNNGGGFNINHLDLAPRFSGVLMGITNFFGTIAGCITPSVTGYFTNNEPTRKQYRKVFLIAAAMSAVGGTFFAVFASGKQQAWNDLNRRNMNVQVDTDERDNEDSEDDIGSITTDTTDKECLLPE